MTQIKIENGKKQITVRECKKGMYIRIDRQGLFVATLFPITYENEVVFNLDTNQLNTNSKLFNRVYSLLKANKLSIINIAQVYLRNKGGLIRIKTTQERFNSLLCC